ncbi:hypothetical protein ACFQAT_11690 [Undibacterium arcticum]|uniref:Secreted protein n=1 Tax=Undibacterium arcticum TaxID=1762892 RepID=A0ABV7F6I0_9BURK
MNIKFSSKGILYALGFITLSAMSVTAFAQSREYQRGYDQGYRDGSEAQSSQDQQRGPVGRIIIEKANYGIREASCDARDTVQRAVGRRRNLSIAANNELCGDPAPNRPKQLYVEYRCGDGPALRARTREGGTVTLTCR